MDLGMKEMYMGRHLARFGVPGLCYLCMYESGFMSNPGGEEGINANQSHSPMQDPSSSILRGGEGKGEGLPSYGQHTMIVGTEEPWLLLGYADGRSHAVVNGPRVFCLHITEAGVAGRAARHGGTSPSCRARVGSTKHARMLNVRWRKRSAAHGGSRGLSRRARRDAR